MGVISTGAVVTAADRRGRPKTVQQGNREWATAIQGINATEWAIPPFIIFQGKHHLSAWYKEGSLPQDCTISVSENDWTTNKLGIEWLEHFDQHTKGRSVGSYRLLIPDGHESHNSIEFHQLREEKKIITLCMPPHSSHLLQPLNVGCFAPLKKAYRCQAEKLMRNKTSHVTRMEFLPCFKAAFDAALKKSNFLGECRGASLVPHDLEAVI